MSAPTLTILSGGAANGLVAALQPAFEAETGVRLAGTFGAVGAMRAKLLEGAPADLLILTPAIISELVTLGHVTVGSVLPIGVVRTAVGVRAGDAVPAIADADQLRATLLTSDGIYIPDPKLATAGIHVAKVLGELGIAETVAARVHVFPNGQTAMAAMAATKGGRPIGITQVTEILNTPGMALVGALPKVFELATVYTIGTTTKAARPDLAARLAAALTAPAAASIRQRCGFEVA